ncbi:RNase adapter RapZ [Halalkalibacterium halodurans]|uniref:Nucleotide-binding protein BH3569 n=1 Tax=Halalkalibacterium halodurans (strain ATCC BAA-125 / DSM 18197 / FERM 7344 / JCM 9153 / C-125) TaxID=272558 RepID=Y3569_HALH5|nr:RNase adapter RapZ [Halalkalibacterium halodurans]Q9K705.1 RecName: Full=Nucleotide-binding protein BH3569 [Halalkalibacterium halodurans C-125]MED4173804.1 RNase adapter RapZ [Halalkalibacterium halodurans]BAB07288.1 BH3569 [Halalkalibacterium halodurans C-125]
MNVKEEIDIVIITGMSGAGKTVAVQSLEDLGYFCVDNLPPALIPKFIELIESSSGKMNKLALVIDLRGQTFFDQLFESIDLLDQSSLSKYNIQILFLDAKDAKLVQRYKETRRSHPLAKHGLPLDGIKKERELLEDLKGRAQQIIDTTDLKPIQLREKIIQRFSCEEHHSFTVNMMSFGFKYGIPIDADLVFDVRFLPNPHYVDHLRPKTGLEGEVSSYVLKWTETQQFIEKLEDLLSFMLPQYKREGKSQVVIGIGCTGGKHRSVTLAEHFAKVFANEYMMHVSHRDVEKGKER